MKGCDDVAGADELARHITWARWREEWKRNRMKWWTSGAALEGWNPEARLAKLKPN
jgi:hypothetical protein